MSIQYYVPFKESTKIRIKKSLLSINTARGTKGLNMCLWGVYHLVTLTDLEHHLIIISSDTENNLSNWPPCSILDSSQSSLCIVTCMYVMHFIFINYNTHTHTHTHTQIPYVRLFLNLPRVIEDYFISFHHHISLAVLSYIMILPLKLKVNLRARSTLRGSWKYKEVWIKLFMTLWVSVSRGTQARTWSTSNAHSNRPS